MAKNPEEWKRKQSENRKGKMPKNIDKLIELSKSRKGIKRPQEFCQIISETHKGKTVSIEVRKKISCKLKGITIEEWTGFSRTDKKAERMSKEYIEWRKAVFKRDNFTCKDCGNNKCYLEAHHIKEFSKYPELRYVVSNGRTLCLDCHNKLNKRGG